MSILGQGNASRCTVKFQDSQSSVVVRLVHSVAYNINVVVDCQFGGEMVRCNGGLNKILHVHDECFRRVPCCHFIGFVTKEERVVIFGQPSLVSVMDIWIGSPGKHLGVALISDINNGNGILIASTGMKRRFNGQFQFQYTQSSIWSKRLYAVYLRETDFSSSVPRVISLVKDT